MSSPNKRVKLAKLDPTFLEAARDISLEKVRRGDKRMHSVRRVTKAMTKAKNFQPLIDEVIAKEFAQDE